MALKHVKEYYFKIQEQYLELLSDVPEYDKALKEGKFTQEQFDNAVKQLEIVKENYERISYIMYLFTLPQRDKRLDKHIQQHKATRDYFKTSGASIDAILSENGDALAEFKRLKESEEK